MQNKSRNWTFIKRPSRPPLTAEEVSYWKTTLAQNLKVGFEFEYNLPSKNGSCDKDNYFCACTNIYSVDSANRLPNTSFCYEQCARWDSGNCPIAKEHGCAGIHCYEFKSPCPSCSLYDRGCSKCPEAFDPNKDPGNIRQVISNILKPTEFVGDPGKKGIYKVIKDGSLMGDGGIEVVTVGRRVQWQPLYQMCKEIIDNCKRFNATTDERCSVHIHLLTSYLTPSLEGDRGGEYVRQDLNELEKPVPEIILANFHQLIRRYQTALIWMTAAGTKQNNLTRWIKFRRSVLPYSAVTSKMMKVVEDVTKNSKKGRYSIINYKPVKFEDENSIRVLHVEARHMDGSMSPSAAVSQACLLYALMLKAVSFSRYGVVESGNDEYMNLQIRIMQNLCNNDGDYGGPRTSETRNLDPFIPTLRAQAKELVTLLKNELSDMGPAGEVLMSLADTPQALHLSRGKSWDLIESEILPTKPAQDPLVEEVDKLINLASIIDCESQQQWVDAVGEEIATCRGQAGNNEKVKSLTQRVQGILDHKLQQAKVFWSPGLGTFISKLDN